MYKKKKKNSRQCLLPFGTDIVQICAVRSALCFALQFLCLLTAYKFFFFILYIHGLTIVFFFYILMYRMYFYNYRIPIIFLLIGI